jgi:hypothetical protein
MVISPPPFLFALEKHMPILLSLLVLFQTSPSEAARMTISVDAERSVVYSAVGNNVYRVSSGSTKSRGYVSAASGLVYKKQEIPETVEPVKATGQIEIVNDKLLRILAESEADAITVPYSLRKGELKVKGSDMSRALNSAMKEKMEELKRSMSFDGTTKADFDFSDMSCQKTATTLSCKYDYSLKLKVSAR